MIMDMGPQVTAERFGVAERCAQAGGYREATDVQGAAAIGGNPAQHLRCHENPSQRWIAGSAFRGRENGAQAA